MKFVFKITQPVMKIPVWFDLNLKYSPFRGKLNSLKKFI